MVELEKEKSKFESKSKYTKKQEIKLDRNKLKFDKAQLEYEGGSTLYFSNVEQILEKRSSILQPDVEMFYRNMIEINNKLGETLEDQAHQKQKKPLRYKDRMQESMNLRERGFSADNVGDDQPPNPMEDPDNPFYVPPLGSKNRRRGTGNEEVPNPDANTFQSHQQNLQGENPFKTNMVGGVGGNVMNGQFHGFNTVVGGPGGYNMDQSNVDLQKQQGNWEGEQPQNQQIQNNNEFSGQNNTGEGLDNGTNQRIGQTENINRVQSGDCPPTELVVEKKDGQEIVVEVQNQAANQQQKETGGIYPPVGTYNNEITNEVQPMNQQNINAFSNFGGFQSSPPVQEQDGGAFGNFGQGQWGGGGDNAFANFGGQQNNNSNFDGFQQQGFNNQQQQQTNIQQAPQEIEVQVVQVANQQAPQEIEVQVVQVANQQRPEEIEVQVVQVANQQAPQEIEVQVVQVANQQAPQEIEVQLVQVGQKNPFDDENDGDGDLPLPHERQLQQDEHQVKQQQQMNIEEQLQQQRMNFQQQQQMNFQQQQPMNFQEQQQMNFQQQQMNFQEQQQMNFQQQQMNFQEQQQMNFQQQQMNFQQQQYNEVPEFQQVNVMNNNPEPSPRNSNGLQQKGDLDMLLNNYMESDNVSPQTSNYNQQQQQTQQQQQQQQTQQQQQQQQMDLDALLMNYMSQNNMNLSNNSIPTSSHPNVNNDFVDLTQSQFKEIPQSDSIINSPYRKEKQVEFNIQQQQNPSQLNCSPNQFSSPFPHEHDAQDYQLQQQGQNQPISDFQFSQGNPNNQMMDMNDNQNLMFPQNQLEDPLNSSIDGHKNIRFSKDPNSLGPELQGLMCVPEMESPSKIRQKTVQFLIDEAEENNQSPNQVNNQNQERTYLAGTEVSFQPGEIIIDQKLQNPNQEDAQNKHRPSIENSGSENDNFQQNMNNMTSIDKLQMNQQQIIDYANERNKRINEENQKNVHFLDPSIGGDLFQQQQINFVEEPIAIYESQNNHVQHHQGMNIPVTEGNLITNLDGVKNIEADLDDVMGLECKNEVYQGNVVPKTMPLFTGLSDNNNNNMGENQLPVAHDEKYDDWGGEPSPNSHVEGKVNLNNQGASNEISPMKAKTDYVDPFGELDLLGNQGNSMEKMGGGNMMNMSGGNMMNMNMGGGNDMFGGNDVFGDMQFNNSMPQAQPEIIVNNNQQDDPFANLMNPSGAFGNENQAINMTNQGIFLSNFTQ